MTETKKKNRHYSRLVECVFSLNSNCFVDEITKYQFRVDVFHVNNKNQIIEFASVCICVCVIFFVCLFVCYFYSID